MQAKSLIFLNHYDLTVASPRSFDPSTRFMKPLPILIASIIFFAIGFIGGRKSSPSSTETGSSAKPDSARRISSRRVRPDQYSPLDNASSEELLALLNEQPKGQVTPWNDRGFPSGSSLSSDPFSASIGILGRLAIKDLDAAEAYVQNLDTRVERISALSEIAFALAQEDPEAALAWAKATSPLDGRTQHIASAIKGMITKDPAAAADAAMGEIEDLEQRNDVLSSIVSFWAQKDPQTALVWLDGQSSSEIKTKGYELVATQIAATDPLAAIQLIEKNLGSTGQSALSGIISQWANKDFDAAKNWFTSQPNPATFAAIFPTILDAWAQRAPSEAAEFLTNLPLGMSPNNKFLSVAKEWGASDRDAALTWAESLEDRSQRNSAMFGIYGQWASQDPQGAASQLAVVTNTSDRRALLYNIAKNWASRDPEATHSWLQSLPIKDRVSASSTALQSLASNQPQIAAQLYDKLIAPNGAGEQAIRSGSRISSPAGLISREWAEYDPVAAAEWAASIPHEVEQIKAYESLAREWAEYDPVATSQWIDGLPVGEARDGATTSLVAEVRRLEPATAFQWANTITNELERFNQLRDVLSVWRSSDSQAAQNAINNANITAQQREQLLRGF